MKFKDLMTGNLLESDTPEVVSQFQKHTDRYRAISGSDELPEFPLAKTNPEGGEGHGDPPGPQEPTGPVKCPHCDQEFTKQQYLNAHITKKHPQ